MTIIEKLVNEMSVDELRNKVKCDLVTYDCIWKWKSIADTLPVGRYCCGDCEKCWNREYKED